MKTSVSLRAPRLVALLAFAFASLSVSTLSAQNATVSTIPVGAMSVNISAGTPVAPVSTTFSIQLLDTPAASGLSAGKIASLTATNIVSTGAGWTSGGLADPAFPYAVKITSGAAVGRYFTISANTADTITVTGIDLTTLSIASGASGDTFEIVPVDTLNTLFGSSTLLGGASAAAADVVTLASGSKLSYYYNTSVVPNRWVRTTGPTTDRGNIAIPLNTSISIARKSTALSLTFTGRVPSVLHTHIVNNSGSTFTNTGFPTDVTLGSLALQTLLPGWVSNTTAATSDTLAVTSGSSTLTYFHNGSNWQRTTGPATNRDSIVIPAGSVITIAKRTPLAGTTILTRSLPYSL